MDYSYHNNVIIVSINTSITGHHYIDLPTGVRVSISCRRYRISRHTAFLFFLQQQQNTFPHIYFYLSTVNHQPANFRSPRSSDL
jgi:hypothetical protein